MPRKSISLRVGLLLLMSPIPAALPASPWAIAANSDRTINTIDLGRNPPVVYGPFLSGELILAGGLGTVAVVPGDHYALVKNSAGPIYLVDISNPTQPVLARTINTREFGGDLAISTEGLFALPTFEVLFVIVNLASFDVSGRVLGASKLFRPNCVAIADDSTAIFCDAANDRLFFGRINSDFTDLESENGILDVQPRNAVIAKDGQTVIVGNGDDTVSVFRITSPGALVPGTPPRIAGLPGVQDSLVVDPSSPRVYVLSTGPSPDRLSILEITGPGSVRLQQAGAVTLVSDADSFSGIDRVAITPAGDRLIVGSAVAPELTLVALRSGGISTVPTAGPASLGVAIFQGPVEPTEPIPALSVGFLVVLAIALGLLGVTLVGGRGSGS